ncbi:MAG: SGNH hydrolase domain-containing protein [Chloroflexota bacterium]
MTRRPHRGALLALALAGLLAAGATPAITSAAPSAGTSTGTAAASPATADTDKDGLTDSFETGQSHTNPNKKDSDGDGLSDAVEDPDGDLLSNLGEQRFKTDPLDADTNHNGTNDGLEDSDHDGVSNAREQDRRPIPAGLTPSLAKAPDDEPVTYSNGCHSGASDPKIHPCAYGATGSSKTVVLFGDSHAAQWLPALIAAGKAAGWKVISLTKSGCPAIDFTSKNSQVFPSCAPWRASAIAWIKDKKPRAVIIGSANGYRLKDPATGKAITGEARKAPFADALRRTLERLPAGPAYGVLADTPRPAHDVPACLRQNPKNLAACGMTRKGSMKPSWDALFRSIVLDAAHHPPMSWMDLQDAVCPYDPCPVVNGNVLIWRDDSHLSATGSAALGPTMRAAVQAVLDEHPAAAPAGAADPDGGAGPAAAELAPHAATTPAALALGAGRSAFVAAMALAQPTGTSSGRGASTSPFARAGQAAPLDTDSDGLPDDWETTYGLSPTKADTDGDGVADPAEDEDHDDLSNLGEWRFGTSPLLADSDEPPDGVLDGREDANGDGIDNAHAQDRRPLPAGVRPTIAKAQADYAAMIGSRCQTGADITTPVRCSYGDLAGDRTIVLFGDSHASMWQPALQLAGRLAGWRIVTLTKSGCPAVDLAASWTSVRTSCAPWRRAAETWLRAHPPAMVILVSARRYDLKGRSGHLLSGAAERDAWAAALARTLAAMPKGPRLLVLGDVIRPRLRVPDCLARVRLMSACTTTRARGTKAGWDAAEMTVATDHAAFWTTLGDLVCPYDPCPVVNGHTMVWRDDSHITATLSRRLGLSMRAIVQWAFDQPAAARARGRVRGPRVAAHPLEAPAARTSRDTDGDGLRDAWEVRYGLDPRSRDSDHDGLHDPSEDLDDDGLGNLGEQRAHTDPLVADTDHDGRSDAKEDSDGDGVSNQIAQDRYRVPADLRPTVRAAPNDMPLMAARGCQTGANDTDLHPCVWGDRTSSTTVVLVGDSHATQWMPAFDRAGDQRGYRVIVLSKSGCPAPDITAENATVRASCAPWRAAVEDWLRQHPPSLIVLIAAQQYVLFDADGRRLEPPASGIAWGEAYARTLARMPAGVRVVVLGEDIKPRKLVPECLSRQTLVSRCTFWRHDGIKPGRAEAEQAAASAAGVQWDTLAWQVCPYDPCPVISDGILMWRDRSHITKTFSRALWPSAAAVVARGLAADPPPTTLRPRHRTRPRAHRAGIGH